MGELLRIGRVAAEAGVNVQTLRFYERKGIVPPPERTDGGYRLYPEDTISLVRFVKRAQTLGFTLSEIQELLELRDNPHRSCRRVKEVAEAKLDEVEEKLADLRRLKKALRGLAQSCDSDAGRLTCPILEALDAD